jgi:succinate dehydrogenase / fumarate reductase flavoprotein subunit
MCRQRRELNQNARIRRARRGFLEFGELLCRDALHRNESCGGHFRVEYQTPDGEAQRDDENFSYVAAWEYQGVGNCRNCTRSRSFTKKCT